MKTPATILVVTLAGGVPAVGCRPDRVRVEHSSHDHEQYDGKSRSDQCWKGPQ